MKILILNRRDIANPAGGGAEIYTHQIAKGLVADYHCDVTVFTSAFPGCQAEEHVDKVRYLRKGTEGTVHLHGFWYALNNRKSFDKIIDEFNGVGFFTFPLKNSVLLIYQMYREFWLRELGVAGVVPYAAEPVILSLYRCKKTVTISPSTKSDLEKLGFRRIAVVMVGLRPFVKIGAEKEKCTTLVFLGRLKSTKRPEDALKIYSKIKKRLPNCRLWFIGRGPEESRLKDMAREVEGVTFFGWVSEEKKYELLCRSHLLLVPGVREGFGINIVEAAAAGLPAIGYSVQGIKDAIRHEVTGYLVNSADEAAERAVELLTDERKYDLISKNCVSYAAGFNWKKRTEEFWHCLH